MAAKKAETVKGYHVWLYPSLVRAADIVAAKQTMAGDKVSRQEVLRAALREYVAKEGVDVVVE